MDDKEPDRNSFTHVLVGDVIDARERLEGANTQTHRRELIRAAFAAMEGLHWRLKRDVFRHADAVTKLTTHERAALLEEAYSVDDRGTVRAQPRFLPLRIAIRLVVNVVKRYRHEYEVDFTHIGWSNLASAVEVRNRLVHPKTVNDLSVSDLEIQQAMRAFCWLLALVIEILEETNDDLKVVASKLSKNADTLLQ